MNQNNNTNNILEFINSKLQELNDLNDKRKVINLDISNMSINKSIFHSNNNYINNNNYNNYNNPTSIYLKKERIRNKQCR